MRKLILGLICSLAIAASTPAGFAQSAPAPQDKVKSLEQKIQSYLQERKPELAIPLLKQVVSLQPDNLNAQANLGVLLFFQGNYADAIPCLRSAVRMQPSLWKIEGLLGIAEKRNGDPVDARKDLETAFPNLHEAKFQKEAGLELIELQSASGDLAQALATTEKLTEILPGDTQVLFTAYEISEQLTYKSLLNMMVVAPDSAEMHMMMAGELARRGDNVHAIAQYREAIRLNPKLPGVHYELGEQLRASYDPAVSAQAEEQYKAAIQVNQFDEAAWRRLGESLAAKGDYKTAEADYRKALQLQPRDSDAETDLAITMISTNRASEALPLLETAEKDDPTNMTAHYRLSQLYQRAGKTQDAQREMKLFFHYRDLKDKMGNIFKQMAGQGTPAAIEHK